MRIEVVDTMPSDELPIAELEKIRKPYLLVEHLLDTRTEATLSNQDSISIDDHSALRSVRNYLAREMYSSLDSCEKSDSRFTVFPLVYALGFAALNSSSAERRNAVLTIGGIADSLIAKGKEDDKTHQIEVDDRTHKIMYGIPLSISYLYGENFDPTKQKWWHFRNEMSPMYEKLKQAIIKYFDPDFISNSHREEFSYKTLKGWGSVI